MPFHIRSAFSHLAAVFWLAVNGLLAALIVYEAVTVAQPYPHQIPAAQLKLMQAAQAKSPPVGERAPDFSLQPMEGGQAVSLASLHGNKPVVLIFGSYTCPIFRGGVGALNEVCRQYKDRAEFVLIYVREAHPVENGSIPENEALEAIHAPASLAERSELARLCVADLGLEMRTLVDDMDDSTAEHYDAWPQRLYVVDIDGRIAHTSPPVQANAVALKGTLETLLARRGALK